MLLGRYLPSFEMFLIPLAWTRNSPPPTVHKAEYGRQVCYVIILSGFSPVNNCPLLFQDSKFPFLIFLGHCLPTTVEILASLLSLRPSRLCKYKSTEPSLTHQLGMEFYCDRPPQTWIPVSSLVTRVAGFLCLFLQTRHVAMALPEICS